AAMIAKEAGAKKLILTHISARYLAKEAQMLEEEAQAVFANSQLAKDFDIVEIPFA
ncbi:MAG: ribonuclease Z, partial [Enterococcus viikkiensis]